MSSSTSTPPRHLLKLPLELQLSIYELVVIEDEPLLLNCPCNSSYRGRYELMKEDEKAWKTGEKSPPSQPALTQTCRSIRGITLPMFYRSNIFRASYCYMTSKIPAPFQFWLRMIGKDNRELLRHLYLYDRNQYYDRNSPGDLKAMKESELFTEMGGRMETFVNDRCCAHLVTFGDSELGAGGASVAMPMDLMRLRLNGEQ